MGGVIEAAGGILSRATQQVETSAQNIANITTPGYKAMRWLTLLASRDGANIVGSGHALNGTHDDAGALEPGQARGFDFSPGKLMNTGNPYDLAISGAGFFVVRSEKGTFYTRDGQFARSDDGRLLTANGLALQALSGDVQLSGAAPQILSDGTILENGQPTGRIETVAIPDVSRLRSAGPSLFAAPDDATADADTQIRQGMIETSNVSTADEMISIMASLRSAETGQRLVQVYDDLMGRVLTAFGQS